MEFDFRIVKMESIKNEIMQLCYKLQNLNDVTNLQQTRNKLNI